MDTFIGFASAVLLISVAYLVDRWRDRANERQKLLVTYLVAAYRSLEAAANREPTAERNRLIEGALADIGLFGSPDQVTMANAFVEQMSSGRGASIDPLLDLLRNDLRNELGLPATIDLPRAYLRMVDPD